jgi:hypothetical protein
LGSEKKPKGAGPFKILAGSLLYTQISNIVDGFCGEIKSYISNGRVLDKVLFLNFGSQDLEESLINPFRDTVKTTIDKKIYCLDPKTVKLIVDFGGNEKSIPLAHTSNGEKANLAEFAKRKTNGTRYLDIKAFSFHGNRIDHRMQYNFANERNVSNIINPDTPQYCCGFVSIGIKSTVLHHKPPHPAPKKPKGVKGKGTSKFYKGIEKIETLDIRIPVSEHLDITTAKSKEMYVYSFISNDIS